MSAGHEARKARRRVRYRPQSEINVTPFVDVMLVLLIVFMIAAPLLTVGVAVDLPRADALPIAETTEPLVLTVGPDGRVYIQETPIALPELTAKLAAVLGAKRDSRIFVRGDREVPYGRIMAVMSTVSSAGYEKVALVAEPPRPER
ncbi:MAG: biopolymer transporter ExbD [Pseudomonadota bacterium]